MSEENKDLLIKRMSLRWNILLSALKAGRTAKLDHMDVLEANKDMIVAGDKETGKVYMTFRREDLLKEWKPKIDHFEIRYFDDKGNELKSHNPPDMELKGAKPLTNHHRRYDDGYNM